MRKLLILPLIILSLFANNCFALDQAELLSNLNFYPNSVSAAIIWKPAFKTEEQKADFFLSAYYQDRGRELVKVDGDTGEISLLRDIQLGTEGSSPTKFIIAGAQLFFVATNQDLGTELWRTDGTAEGTLLVKDINSGSASTSFGEFIAFQNGTKVAFSASTPELGAELYVSNGTNVGTVVYDIYDSVGLGSSPGDFFLHQEGQLVFRCSVAGGTNALCEFTDGFVPTVLKSGITYPGNFEKLNNTQFVFAATDSSLGAELFISDGTEVGTSLLKDLNVGVDSSEPDNLIFFNNQVYFSANASGANVGISLWRTDGTDVGTVIVEDLNPSDTVGSFSDFQVINNDLLFFASSLDTGNELWRITGGEVSLVKDLTPGVGGSLLSDLTPVYPEKNKAIFSLFTDASGVETWVTDGTILGTKILKDIWPGEEDSNPAIYHDELQVNSFLIANTPTTVALYTTDGTETGTVPAVDLNFGADLGSAPSEVSLITSNLLFVVASTVRYGAEPFVVNLSTKEITLLKDIYPSRDDSNAIVVGRLGDRVLFSANDGVIGRELWITDGTPAGTVLLKDIYSGSDSGEVSKGVVLGDNVIFRARNATNGLELWKSDGTIDGTVLLKDINSGASNSDPLSSFAVLGNQVVFDATTSSEGKELWVTDGTAVGTNLLKDIQVGSVGSFPDYLKTSGSQIYFQAKDGSTGAELWVTDGTTVGTILVKDIRSGGNGSLPLNFTEYQGLTYFIATTDWEGRELWKTDGTDLGTELVIDLATGSDDGLAFDIPLAVLNDQLFFSGMTNATGVELYKTLGTAGTTEMVKDILSGTGSSSPEQLLLAGNKIYFSASTADAGMELWATDGTEAGTQIVSDVFLGAGSSSPELFFAENGALYFSVESHRIGQELWRIVFDQCPDDLAKKEPNVCGCDVIEQDLNLNGVVDCLLEADFDAFIEDAQIASRKIKFDQQNTPKQITRLKTAIKAFKQSVRLVLAEAISKVTLIPKLDLKSGKKLRRQLKSALLEFSREPSKANLILVRKQLKALKAYSLV